MKPAGRFAWIVLSLALWATAPAMGAPAPSGDVPLVGEKIRQLMQDRDYVGAIRAIDEATKDKDAPRDYLTYLKGRALFLQKQYDKAATAFGQLEKQSPESPWVRRARFGRAVALVRKGDFRGAERIYRAEAEYLLSSDRKQELADIYLEFANGYFDPPKDDQKPDYQKALEFYQKALEVGPKPQKQAEIELLAAQCQQYLGKLDEAAAAYDKFTKDHPASKLDVEARFRLGECHLAQGRVKEARRAWQDLLAKHEDSSSKRIAEATFNIALTWRLPQPANDEELSLGVAALETFLKRFPKHALSGRAHLAIAQSYLHRGRHEDAVASLVRFLDGQKNEKRPSKEVPDARVLLGRSYQLQKKFDQALATWRDYLSKHPAHKGWSKVQREIINTEYLIGQEKAAAKQYAQARESWTQFLAKYPLDGRNPAILYEFGRMNHQQTKWSDAIADWRRLVSKYPGTNEASQAQFMIGQTLEEELGQLEDALDEYRKVTWGNFAQAAAGAIARLTAKSMTIATERVFRSDETPKLKLTTRNIEKVTVRAYKVDLQTYFRKMHLARGLEQLDISLIDPDATFEFTVPGYKKHQQIASRIDVALPKKATAGAMAVTVSSKTLEATTLVLQSDLDVIVKSSRDEAFVFAQNMRTGKPWPGVKLLVSDGRNVFAEAATGDDGVMRHSYKELKAAGDVRVFAVAGDHVASNQLGLEGVGAAVGLADKGYIYTDRPAYRAGQIVHVRGCLRRVDGDAYVIDKDKKYTVEVFDSRNRLVHEHEVALGQFGTFHNHFVLPPTSPQGPYRVQVRDRDQKTYQGTFVVHEYQLEPIRLVIDTPRTVYYRGERIKGVIRAEYYYGAPLAGAEIQYRLADDRLHTARTDEKGEVSFELATREFSETQPLPLVVTLPQRNLQTASTFLLSCQGFSIGLDTVRRVYVAGETFEVSLVTRDAQGKPTGKKLSLKVFEQTTVQGVVAERLVASHEIASDDKDGKARQTLKLDKGGMYVLRAEGIDRFNNPIWAQHLVQISDDKDEVRLRILADEHTYRVGDTARVRLHWREKPALALVTYQGARILDYRLVELKEGDNTLEIPMGAKLAPNFDLAVAVMTDVRRVAKDKQATARRFHEATSPFDVQRDLRISVSVKRLSQNGQGGPHPSPLPEGEGTSPIRPGEDVEVTLTATDPQGNPVAAEVSLALVEQSLLDRFGSSVAAIQDFFRGERRQPAMRTTSSITFSYCPATRPINRRLLTEADRLAVAGAEAESLSEGLETRSARMPAAMLEPSVASPATPSGGLMYRGAVTRAYAAPAPVPQSLGTGTVQYPPTQTRYSGREVRWNMTGGQTVIMSDERYDAFSHTLGFSRSGYDAKSEGARKGERMWFGGAAGYPVTVGRYVASQKFSADAGDQLVAVNRRGEMRGLAEGRLRPGTLVDELEREGTVLLPALGIQETGYWNPAVTTGKDGRATLTFTMPQRSTAWKLLAKGITTDTLAGEATEAVVAKKELFGQLKLPAALVEGDEVEIEASVHNDAVTEGPIEVTLKATVAGRTSEEKKTIDAAKGIKTLAFRVKIERPEPGAGEKSAPQSAAAFELTVAAGQRRDVVRRSVPLLPYGMPVYATAAGSATSDISTWVDVPAGASRRGLSLQILVGPSVEQSLMDILLAPAPACQIDIRRVASGIETATSDLMAAVALQTLLGGSREAAGPRAATLDGRIRSTVSLLVSSQNDDGGWSWTGRGGASNRYSTARAVWALTLARKAGYVVPDDARNKAMAFLRNQAAATSPTDYETSAVLLHALTVAGEGDFALANRLYRERPALSAAALAYLSLAFVEMDRKATAAELLAVLAQRNLDVPVSRRADAAGCLPWNHSPAELRALVALAVQKVSPTDPKAKELVDWLLAHRTGHRWSPEKATGPATLALCDWYGRNRFQGERYALAVSVNGKQAARLDVDPADGTKTVDVPAGMLSGEGKQRIGFQITGRGQYCYQCILSGFVPADKLASTTRDWTVRRIYEPAPLEMDGREIPRGFDILSGNYATFRNPLTQLPAGRRAMVELNVWRQNLPWNTPEEQLEYLVITEPIPSGTSVIEQSITGPFERFELSPGAITFYIGSRRDVGTIRYELVGYLPGQYRTAPTVVRNAHRLDQMAVAETKTLDVLAAEKKSRDEYRLTPRELFELGKRHFDRGDFKTAQTHLAELVAKWNVQPDPYKSAVQMLFDSHLALGPASQIVRHFEIIKERWPSEQIPFAKIIKVAAAYDEMGEFERSYLVYRATVESSFRRESGVAGFLDAQGEFLRSVDVMGRLLREYPPESYVAAASYALAQRVYAKAPQAASDPGLRRAKVNRIDLVRRAWRMLEAFLTAHPDDAAADQAAFSAANALLELKKYPQAIAACERYAQRYPKSDLLDSYWYVIGYCHFATGEHREALEMCRKVAEAKRTDRQTGQELESLNKWQAIYILGQVFHSLGQPADAIREYGRVADRFADAKEAIEYFQRKAIGLPEVTTVRSGRPVAVKLKFRNVPTCDVKVYRIDLMKFSLLKRNLGGITQINLAGIHPYHEATVALGDGKDYRDRTHRLAMPLKDEGAYLVVCRGDNLHASGLVLVTPLAIEVQEDAASGRVRTTVKDATTDKYVASVHVKAIGTGNQDFVSGETDLRGVFVADGIQGTATVIAQAEPTRYAFFRGSQPLAMQPKRPAATPAMGKARASLPAAPNGAMPMEDMSVLDGQLLQNLQIQNATQQRAGVQELQQNYDSGAQGVEASKALE